MDLAGTAAIEDYFVGVQPDGVNGTASKVRYDGYRYLSKIFLRSALDQL